MTTPGGSRARSKGAVVDGALLGVLVVFTVVNFAAGDAHDSARGWWIALILGVAFAKAVAIGCCYMGLARAPVMLLLAFLAWAVLFFALTVMLSIV
ncbi:MAG TPA: cytochrome C oxidase subunit IV family protein [Microbacterium sp.]|nr:cytochrome C oxidase subunit IV family protein [Microbacterium sp.]